MNRCFLMIVALAVACGGPHKEPVVPEPTSGVASSARKPPAEPTSGVASNARRPLAFEEASRYLLGDGRPQDTRRATELFFAACQEGDARACVTWFEIPGRPDDKVGAVTREVWKHCKAGDRRSCHMFFEKVSELEVPADSSELKRDCEQDIAPACSFYAWRLRGDEAEALPFWRKACELGEPVACWGMWEPDMDPALRETALRAHRAGCEAEVPQDCARLRALLGRPAHDSRYYELLLRKCQELDLAACGYAALSPHREIHIAVAKIICAFDEKECGFMHATIMFSGGVVAIDPELAARAYQDVCLGAEKLKVDKPYEPAERARACVDGARLYLSDERPGGPDRARADVLLNQVCELGDTGLSGADLALVREFCAGRPKSP